MTRLGVAPRVVTGWVQGLVEGAEPGTLLPGAIEEGENLLPTRAGRMRTRGGSRIMLALVDPVGSAALDHVCVIEPFTNVGGLVVGFSASQDLHYVYRVTSDMVLTGSGVAMTGWTQGLTANTPARPNMAELWEKMFIADADATVSATLTTRNELKAVDSSGVVSSQVFTFASGSAVPKPYCVESYNGVLFMAGYGTETVGDLDRPEYLRHSFLGRDPSAAGPTTPGFEINSWAIIGTIGQRITALRAGGRMLLVSKENEFFRVTGYGRAFAGWQYQIEPVDSTQGIGAANPKALIYAEGYFYGIGAQGPFRTDGFRVESLVGPRRPSWRGIDKIIDSWVAYNPEHRQILFGLHPVAAASGRSDTWPWVVWAWDVQRDVWQPDRKYGADLFHAGAISTTSSEGPSAAPSGPSTDNITSSVYRGKWTNNDTSAETEFWEKLESGGTWTLISIVAAATDVLTRLSRASHASYYFRVRHRKGGVTSAWDAEAGTIAQTLIAKPGCTAAQVGSTSLIELTLTQNSDGTDLEVERQIDSGGYTVWNTYSSQPEGTFLVSDPGVACGEVADYRARSRDSGWNNPNGAYSSVSQVDLTSGCDEE